MLLSEVLGSIFQTILFTLIPLIWWFITARKKENFFSWIGLKKPEGDKKQIIIFIIAGYAICEIVGLVVTNIVITGDWNHSTYEGMGIKGLPVGFLYAYIHTAFSEEILYRGFLQKRLQNKLGFKAGTIIQAAIFGASHVILSYKIVTFAEGILLFVYPMFFAIIITFINEKKCKGSILPGWLIHGTLNFVTQLLQLW